MISRRNIRVKVMQTLYTINSAQGLPTTTDPAKQLTKQIDSSIQLFIYILYVLAEVGRYAETDSLKRSSKNLPSHQDLNVDTKLSGNEFLAKIIESPTYIKAIEDLKPERFEGTENEVKKIYNTLIETEEYKKYLSEKERNKKSEKDIFSFVFNNLLLPSDDFTSHVEEYFTNWDDDCEMIQQLMMNFLQRPVTYNFQQMLSEEKWNFARTLLKTTIEKKELTQELIKPKLKNWDADRIAVLDMILMEMGICELLFFETIPPKVTINEYIDLAKLYSTPMSGQFVNGILDNIHKELDSQNKIRKISFNKKP